MVCRCQTNSLHLKLYAQEYGVEFNPKKSMCISFGRAATTRVFLAGKDLKWETKVKHLGNYICNDLSEYEDVQRKKGDLAGRVNCLMGTIGDAPEHILLKVFENECCHFYGSHCWDFTQKHFKDFNTMWNKCARRILKVPRMTHTRFLPIMCKQPPSETQIMARFINMCKRMISNKNSLTEYFVRAGMKCSNTIIGKNLRKVCKIATMSFQELLEGKKKPIQYIHNSDDICTVKVINELRSGSCGPLNDAERLLLFDFLCTN